MLIFYMGTIFNNIDYIFQFYLFTKYKNTIYNKKHKITLFSELYHSPKKIALCQNLCTVHFNVLEGVRLGKSGGFYLITWNLLRRMDCIMSIVNTK